MLSRWGMTTRTSGGPMEQVNNERYQEKAAIMKLVKHPYKAGIKAQRGVEF